jgi:hypothetical protein
LPYKWPLALDLLKKQYDALPSQKLLAFQSQFLKDEAPTTEFRLFGNKGYVTTDPKNVEAIVSTQFKGTRERMGKVPTADNARLSSRESEGGVVAYAR